MELKLSVVRLLDLETVIQSEVSQNEEKQIRYANIYMESKKGKVVLKNLGAGQE